VSETKQYLVVPVFQPTLFSRLCFFLDMVGLFAYLPTLFFVVCFMMQLDAKNIVCCPQATVIAL
jgi:hypothetical protein